MARCVGAAGVHDFVTMRCLHNGQVSKLFAIQLAKHSV